MEGRIKMKSKDKTWIINQYNKIEQLIIQYQCTGECEELINNYNKLFEKFILVICDGKDDNELLSSNVIRRFICLYSPTKSIIHKTQSYVINSSVSYVLKTTIKNIYKRYKSYEKDDIKNCLIVAFLSLAKNYKPKGDNIARFPAYFNKSFHFKLYEEMKFLGQKEIMYKQDMEIPYDDEEEYSIKNNPINFKEDYIHDEISTEPDIYINDDWVRGINTSDVFISLLPSERKMIKLKYIDKLTDEELTSVFGYTRTTILRRRKNIVNSVKTMALKHRLLTK